MASLCSPDPGLHHLRSDEPPALGGTDAAPNPVEQLLVALGNCLAVGYAANATARGIAVTDLRITVTGDVVRALPAGRLILSLLRELNRSFAGSDLRLHKKLVAGDLPATRFLFVAEGLFIYLPAEGVRALVTALRERFPGAELVAEVAHSRVVRMMRGRMGLGKFRRQFGISGDVVYQFGLQDSHDMEAWSPGLVLLDDWAYFDEDEPRLGWMRPFTRWSLFRQAQWTVHYRLGTPPK